MPTLSVRISEDERRKLLKYGPLSRSVREALRLYLNTKKSHDLIERLEVLQRKNSVRSTPSAEVRLIAQDRGR